MTLIKTLAEIQKEIHVPKSMYNSFGGFAYRSCEMILESIKPLLEKYHVALTITDDLIQVGDRYYVKSTARLFDTETESLPIETSAWAREPLQKKGQDDSQITGSASSYARKYALNAMFLLDDAKDADSDDVHGDRSITEAMAKNLKRALDEVNVDESKLFEKFAPQKISDLTQIQYNEAMDMIEKQKRILARKKVSAA